jgi:hypothetical protein
LFTTGFDEYPINAKTAQEVSKERMRRKIYPSEPIYSKPV